MVHGISIQLVSKSMQMSIVQMGIGYIESLLIVIREDIPGASCMTTGTRTLVVFICIGHMCPRYIYIQVTSDFSEKTSIFLMKKALCNLLILAVLASMGDAHRRRRRPHIHHSHHNHNKVSTTAAAAAAVPVVPVPVPLPPVAAPAPVPLPPVAAPAPGESLLDVSINQNKKVMLRSYIARHYRNVSTR